MAPSNAVAYSGNPVTLTISGGTIPYTVASTNTDVIAPRLDGTTIVFNASNVPEDTAVDLEVRDANNTLVTATITVKPSVINNTLTVTPDPATPGVGCGTAVCSGMTALVSVQLINMATPLVNRSARFDVVQGDYQFITDSNATTFANTITATTDQNGYAHVRLKANVNAPTQYAILKVTDEVGGSVLQTAFTIAQYTDGAGTLTTVPTSQTITAYYEGACSFGTKVDYIIHGGTPPYAVTSTLTGVATVSPSTVLTNGAGFTATTVGQTCGEVTFNIKDATGWVITATLENKMGTHTVEEPVVPDPVAFFTTAPDEVAVAVGAIASFVLGGGTPPYLASSGNTAVATAAIAGSSLTITGVASGTATITVADSKGAVKSVNVTVP